MNMGASRGVSIAKDMVAVRIGPDLRLASAGGPYAWELEKDGRELGVRVDGQLVFNNAPMTIRAAVSGLRPGLYVGRLCRGAYRRRQAGTHIVGLMPPFAGYHLYYPSHSQPSAAFALLVEALRYRS